MSLCIFEKNIYYTRTLSKLGFIRLVIFFLLFTGSSLNAEVRQFPSSYADVSIPHVAGVRQHLLENIAPLIEKSIQNGFYPGAVVAVGHRGQMIYRGVFGSKKLEPFQERMTYDTIFDLASITKVFVTTTAVMQLVERGRIELDSPVGRYWPDFNSQGKQRVTVRELLTHTSGLPSGLTFHGLPWMHEADAHPDYKLAAIAGVEKANLVHIPGKVFAYSDVNFIALGHLVEIVTGQKLEDYAKNNIFEPLNLKNTFYLPAAQYKSQIAPTEIVKGDLRWGMVHDDTAYLMGGVAGHAGLFSNAKDMATFAEVLLNGGQIPVKGKPSSKYLLSPLTILKMTTPQTPASMVDVHGFGWDIDSRYASRGVLFPMNSYGHTGWTGTSIWLDPNTHTWLIILTSRTHPKPAPRNVLVENRRTIANIVAASIVDYKPHLKTRNTGKGELARAYAEEQDTKR